MVVYLLPASLMAGLLVAGMTSDAGPASTPRLGRPSGRAILDRLNRVTKASGTSQDAPHWRPPTTLTLAG